MGNDRQWAAIGKGSMPTAQRDINELIQRAILRRNPGGSKNTSHDLTMEADRQVLRRQDVGFDC